MCFSINPFVMKNSWLSIASWWYKPGTKKFPLYICALRSTCLGYFILELYLFPYWQIHFSAQIFVLLQPFPTVCLSSSPFLLFCGRPYLLLSTGISTALHPHPLCVILLLNISDLYGNAFQITFPPLPPSLMSAFPDTVASHFTVGKKPTCSLFIILTLIHALQMHYLDFSHLFNSTPSGHC